tara:strand:- start:320 stop:775 length:456 start_codon:yes stop_codon:yes gene_type:complete
MTQKVSSILVGVSGEYFVAAELSRRGYIASITLRNTQGIDIVATNESGKKSVNIQVKTKSKGSWWLLSKKAEEVKDKNIFYVFVELNKIDELPLFYIVPSRDVAKRVSEGHKKWLETPGKKGQQRNDSNMRAWRDEENKYLNKWELLKLDS